MTCLAASLRFHRKVANTLTKPFTCAGRFPTFDLLEKKRLKQFSVLHTTNNQSAEGAGGLGIIRGNKVGETE